MCLQDLIRNNVCFQTSAIFAGQQLSIQTTNCPEGKWGVEAGPSTSQVERASGRAGRPSLVLDQVAQQERSGLLWC